MNAVALREEESFRRIAHIGKLQGSTGPLTWGGSELMAIVTLNSGKIHRCGFMTRRAILLWLYGDDEIQKIKNKSFCTTAIFFHLGTYTMELRDFCWLCTQGSISGETWEVIWGAGD